MKTEADFRAVLDRITFPQFTYKLGHDGNFYLQISSSDICNVTGSPLDWSGRKWRLSIFMTDSELVQTAFMATMAAVEHETRESFKYRGQSVFDPHYDVEQLYLLRAANALDERLSA